MSSLLRELDVEPQQDIVPRILKIIDIIEHSSFKKDRIKALAEDVSLSESRLQHLFKEKYWNTNPEIPFMEKTGQRHSINSKQQ